MCCCCCSMKQRNSSQQPQRDQSFRSQNEKWKKPFRSNTISRTRYIVFCTEDVNFEKKAKATKHIPPPFVVVLVVIEREKKSAFVCVCIYNVLLLKKKSEDEWDPHVCRFLPANEKKIWFSSVLGGHFGKKTRERKDERKEIYSREISSVLRLSLLAFLINSLERTKEREIR